MSKYGHRTGHWLDAVVNKVGGEYEAERFLRGELMITLAPASQWSAWNSVQLGKYASGEAYIEALTAKKFDIIQDADDLLLQIAVSEQVKKLDLVAPCPADFGFKDKVPRSVFFGKAFELGFERCPAEVAPALLLQHSSSFERVFVTCEGIPLRRKGLHSGEKLAFRLNNPREVSSRATIGTCGMDTWDYTLEPERRWVFVKPDR